MFSSFCLISRQSEKARQHCKMKDTDNPLFAASNRPRLLQQRPDKHAQQGGGRKGFFSGPFFYLFVLGAPIVLAWLVNTLILMIECVVITLATCDRGTGEDSEKRVIVGVSSIFGEMLRIGSRLDYYSG